MKKLFVIIFLLELQHDCHAQLLTNNNVQYIFTSGVQLTVKGDIQNNAGTTMDNFGIIDLDGNWTNNSGTSIFGTSGGTVIMNGVNQNIGGSDVTMFNNLDLVTGSKTLFIDAIIGAGSFPLTGGLHCNDAVLDLNSHTALIYNGDPAGITTTTGFILSEDIDNSSRVWWVGAAPGIHTIPFGTGSGDVFTFSFNITTPVPGTTSGSLRISTYKTLPDNTPYPTTPVLVTNIFNAVGADNSANVVDRFWHIEKMGTADYWFNYPVTENAANGNSNMRAQEWNPSMSIWSAPLSGQTNPNAQTVYAPNITTPNPFVMNGGTWTLAQESNLLPVALLFFDAKEKDGRHVLCSWSTASEINNDYFIITKSRDGIHFDDAGMVDGAGNYTGTLNYSFADESPYHGISYYRLRQVDFDGTIAFSQIVSVNFDEDHFSYTIFPNPTTGNLFIGIDKGFESITGVTIRDVAGKIILNEIPSGSKELIKINLEGMATGFYFIEMKAGEYLFTEKIQLTK